MCRIKIGSGFFKRWVLEEKPKCWWCPVFFMIYLSLIFSTLITVTLLGGTSYLGHCFGLGLMLIIKPGFLDTLLMTYLGVLTVL